MSVKATNSRTPDNINIVDFFDHALCGYVITDAEGKIIKANNTIASWLGCSSETLIGNRASDLLSIGGKIYYETHLWPLLRLQGFFDEVALDLGCSNQQKLPVLINALHRKDAAGKPQHVWLTIFKATDRRTYEQNLKDAKASLELSLANAMQVTTLREQFIAILGHDLRNPLGSIIAGSSLLANSNPTDPNAKLIKVIHRSAMRMAELINNIMDFARTRLGEGIVVNRQLTNMEPVLHQVVQELRTIYPTRQIESSFDIKKDVFCDGPRIAQLLSNLVANAITHGFPDTPVHISAAYENNIFEMKVCNSGHQIPSELISKLFEPFTRESERPSQNGLGLGLYIASQIAKSHKAELTATSSPQETCFQLRF